MTALSQTQPIVIPAGFKFTTDAANKAAKAGKYIAVGGDKTNQHSLSGRKQQWKKDPTVIYNTDYRITGRPADVKLALEYAGMPSADADRVVANSITSQNAETTKADEIAKEEALYEQIKKQTVKKESPYTLRDVLWFAEHMKDMKIATQSGERTGAAGTKRTQAASLADKINNLKDDKVIDVSSIDQQTGSGARVVARPKTERSKKFGTTTIPIISNNVANYRRAIELAYGADGLQAYANDIATVEALINRANSPVAVTGVAPIPVAVQGAPAPAAQPPIAQPPARVPGAMIAPPVTIQPVTTVGGAGLAAIPPLGQQ